MRSIIVTMYGGPEDGREFEIEEHQGYISMPDPTVSFDTSLATPFNIIDHAVAPKIWRVPIHIGRTGKYLARWDKRS